MSGSFPLLNTNCRREVVRFSTIRPGGAPVHSTGGLLLTLARAMSPENALPQSGVRNSDLTLFLPLGARFVGQPDVWEFLASF